LLPGIHLFGPALRVQEDGRILVSLHNEFNGFRYCVRDRLIGLVLIARGSTKIGMEDHKV
jgi:hypothetical protein